MGTITPPGKPTPLIQEIVPVLKEDVEGSKKLLVEIFLESISTFEDFQKLVADNPTIQKVIEKKFKKTIYASPELKISILSISSGQPRVIAEVASEKEEVLLTLPDTLLAENYRVLPLASKIKRFLYNVNLLPTMLPKENVISFSPTLPTSTEWSTYPYKLKLPISEVKLVYRSNGNICYIFLDSITTWDWKNNIVHSKRLKVGPIDIFKELPNKKLAFINKKGQLFIENLGLIPCENAKDILGISDSRCIIKLQNGTSLIFCLKSKTFIQGIGICEEIIPLTENSFAVLSKKNLLIFNLENGLYKSIEIDKNITKIEILSNSTILLTTGGKQDSGYKYDFKIWNFIENKLVETFDNITLLRHIDLYSPVTLDKGSLFLFTSLPRSKLYAHLITNDEQEQGQYEITGKWGINSILTLRNGAILYDSKPRYSGIYIIRSKSDIVKNALQKLEIKINNELEVDNLTELPDGSVAIQQQDEIQIIRPKLVPDSIVKQEDYLGFLSQLHLAIREGNLYFARRSYEKARRLKPKEEEPCNIFLSYLDTIPHSRLKTRVRLDLNRLKSSVDSPKNLLPKTQRYKKRLFIGEGSSEEAFSYTEAIINKHKHTHPNLGKSIIATELESPKTYDEIEDRLAYLTSKGVTIRFGINGTALEKDFQGQKFKRIHWTCPFGGGSDIAKEQFKTVMPAFFRSASSLQDIKDRIHVVLACRGKGKWSKTRQEENPIVLGATAAGYRLIRKRAFSEARYPGYRHEKTAGGSGKIPDRKSEFVFEKTAIKILGITDLAFAKTLINPREKTYSIKTDVETKKPSTKKEEIKPVGLEKYYFECSTDEDSSDYYEEESISLSGLKGLDI